MNLKTHIPYYFPLLVAGLRVAFDLSRPPKKPKQLSLLFPKQVPEIERTYRLRTLARVSLEPPSQIRASPRPQSIPTRSIPKKPDLFPHGNLHDSSIGTQDTQMFSPQSSGRISHNS